MLFVHLNLCIYKWIFYACARERLWPSLYISPKNIT